MAVEGLCAPALLYLGFSLVQITIDLFRGDYSTSFFKFLVMILFTVILNMLCIRGLTIISWFIVFIPFIMMTYISSILFMMFGINPDKKAIYIQPKEDGSQPSTQQQPQQPQKQSQKQQPRPNPGYRSY
jgi:glucan phosphoethanolaminetransferase (alkaline phosphatase superfamily)